MRHTFRLGSLTPFVTIVLVLAASLPASAQYLLLSPTLVDEPREASASQTPPARPSLVRPFTDVLGDIRHLPQRGNLGWLVLGMGLAAGAHSADAEISRELSKSSTNTFRPGAIVGGTPLEMGAAFATYAIGRATNSQIGRAHV